jgi:hypothetical protein
MPEGSQPAYEVGQTTRGPLARSGRVSGTVALVAIDGIHPESPVNCRGTAWRFDGARRDYLVMPCRYRTRKRMRPRRAAF